MQYGSFARIAKDFRPSNPGEFVNGSVGIAIEKMEKKIDPDNPFFSMAYHFAKVNGLDMDFCITKEPDKKEVKSNIKVRKK